MIKKESILFVLPWDLTSVGGVNQVVENLIEQTTQDDALKPILLVSKYSAAKFQCYEERGYSKIFGRLPPLEGRIFSFIKLLKYTRNMIIFLYQLRKIIKRENIKIINIHFPSLTAFNFLMYRIFLGKNIKLILSFHGADLQFIEKSNSDELKLWHILLAKADYLVFCSNNLMHKFKEITSRHYHQCRVVHNGIAADKITNAIKENTDLAIDVLSDQDLIVNIATFEHKKGQDILLSSFAKLHQDFPKAKLVLIGRHDNYFEEIESLVFSLGLSEKVELIKNLPHSDAMCLLQYAKLFILPSRKEPFGIVILEAGLLNLPVIATRVGGIPEILTDGDNALLFESEDVDSLAEHIRSLLTNKKLASQLSASLNKNVTENFSWHKAYLEYMKIINET